MGSKGGGAVPPWGGAMEDVAMAQIPAIFGGSVQENRSPYGKVSYDYIPGGKSEIQKAGEQFGKPTGMENQAGQILSGYDPRAFLQGVQGYLGQGASALGDAQSQAMSSLGGSEDALSRTISGKNLDVTGGAYANRNAAIRSEMERLLGGQMEGIKAGAQRATGGVGAGSAGLESQRRAVTGAASQLGETLAQVSAQDLARERGLQEAAVQTGLQIPLARAGALTGIGQGYQGLGSIFGQAATAADQNLLSQAGALGGLGQQLATRQFAGTMSPYEYMLNFLTAARQSPGVPGQSVLGSVLQGLGGVAGGVGKLAGGFGWGG